MENETAMVVKSVSVPMGLEELMEGLTKEVISKKPKNLCLFASEHFSHLLTLRDQGLYEGQKVRQVKTIIKRQTTEKGHKLTLPTKQFPRQLSYPTDGTNKLYLEGSNKIVSQKSENTNNNKNSEANKNRAFQKYKQRRNVLKAVNDKQRPEKLKFSATKKFVPKSSSIEEVSEPYVKDGKLAVKPAKVVKRSQTSPESFQPVEKIIVPVLNKTGNDRGTSDTKIIPEIPPLKYGETNEEKGAKENDSKEPDILADAELDITGPMNSTNEHHEVHVQERFQEVGAEKEKENTSPLTWVENEATNNSQNNLGKIVHATGSPQEQGRQEEEKSVKVEEGEGEESEAAMSLVDKQNSENNTEPRIAANDSSPTTDVDQEDKNAKLLTSAQKDETVDAKQGSVHENPLSATVISEEPDKIRETANTKHDDDIQKVGEKILPSNASDETKLEQKQVDHKISDLFLSTERKHYGPHGWERENVEVKTETINERSGAIKIADEHIEPSEDENTDRNVKENMHLQEENQSEERNHMENVQIETSGMEQKPSDSLKDMEHNLEEGSMKDMALAKTEEGSSTVNLAISENFEMENGSERSGYDPQKLQEELKTVHEESELENYKNLYNPHLLRKEIKDASFETTATKATGPVVDKLSPNVAATKIQALWRGFQLKLNEGPYKLSEIRDVKNNLPGVKDKSAAIIQALWRGYKARQSLNFKKDSSHNGPSSGELLEHTFQDHQERIGEDDTDSSKKVCKYLEEVNTSLALPGNLVESTIENPQFHNESSFDTSVNDASVKKVPETIKISESNSIDIIIERGEEAELEATPQPVIGKLVETTKHYSREDKHFGKDNTVSIQSANKDSQESVETTLSFKKIAAVITIQKFWRNIQINKQKLEKRGDTTLDSKQSTTFANATAVTSDGALEEDYNNKYGTSSWGFAEASQAALKIQSFWRRLRRSASRRKPMTGQNDFENASTKSVSNTKNRRSVSDEIHSDEKKQHEINTEADLTVQKSGKSSETDKTSGDDNQKVSSLTLERKLDEHFLKQIKEDVETTIFLKDGDRGHSNDYEKALATTDVNESDEENDERKADSVSHSQKFIDMERSNAGIYQQLNNECGEKEKVNKLSVIPEREVKNFEDQLQLNSKIGLNEQTKEIPEEVIGSNDSVRDEQLINEAGVKEKFENPYEVNKEGEETAENNSQDKHETINVSVEQEMLNCRDTNVEDGSIKSSNTPPPEKKGKQMDEDETNVRHKPLVNHTSSELNEQDSIPQKYIVSGGNMVDEIIQEAQQKIEHVDIAAIPTRNDNIGQAENETSNLQHDEPQEILHQEINTIVKDVKTDIADQSPDDQMDLVSEKHENPKELISDQGLLGEVSSEKLSSVEGENEEVLQRQENELNESKHSIFQELDDKQNCTDDNSAPQKGQTPPTKGEGDTSLQLTFKDEEDKIGSSQHNYLLDDVFDGGLVPDEETGENISSAIDSNADTNANSGFLEKQNSRNILYEFSNPPAVVDPPNQHVISNKQDQNAHISESELKEGTESCVIQSEGADDVNKVLNDSLKEDISKSHNYDPQKLQSELKVAQEEAQLVQYKNNYNPHLLRKEIKEASFEETDTDEKKSEDSQNVAATRIQALWRGFQVRQKKSDVTGKLMLGNLNDVKDKSATIIQALWRGYCSRKLLKSGKEPETVDFDVKLESERKDTDDLQQQTPKPPPDANQFFGAELDAADRVVEELNNNKSNTENPKRDSNDGEPEHGNSNPSEADVKVYSVSNGKADIEDALSVKNHKETSQHLSEGDSNDSFLENISSEENNSSNKNRTTSNEVALKETDKNYAQHIDLRNLDDKTELLQTEPASDRNKLNEGTEIETHTLPPGDDVFQINTADETKTNANETQTNQQLESTVQGGYGNNIQNKGIHTEDDVKVLQLADEENTMSATKETNNENQNLLDAASTEDNETRKSDGVSEQATMEDVVSNDADENQVKTEEIKHTEDIDVNLGNIEDGSVTISEENTGNQVVDGSASSQPAEEKLDDGISVEEIQGGKLSDEELRKALEILDELPVPQGSPEHRREHHLVKSATVDEPKVEKTYIPPLMKAFSTNDAQEVRSMLNKDNERVLSSMPDSVYKHQDLLSDIESELQFTQGDKSNVDGKNIGESNDSKRIKKVNALIQQQTTNLEKEVKDCVLNISESINEENKIRLNNNIHTNQKNKEKDINLIYNSKYDIPAQHNESPSSFDITRLRSEIEEVSREIRKEGTIEEEAEIPELENGSENQLGNILDEKEDNLSDSNESGEWKTMFDGVEVKHMPEIDEGVPKNNLASDSNLKSKVFREEKLNPITEERVLAGDSVSVAESNEEMKEDIGNIYTEIVKSKNDIAQNETDHDPQEQDNAPDRNDVTLSEGNIVSVNNTLRSEQNIFGGAKNITSVSTHFDQMVQERDAQENLKPNDTLKPENNSRNSVDQDEVRNTLASPRGVVEEEFSDITSNENTTDVSDEDKQAPRRKNILKRTTHHDGTEDKQISSEENSAEDTKFEMESTNNSIDLPSEGYKNVHAPMLAHPSRMDSSTSNDSVITVIRVPQNSIDDYQGDAQDTFELDADALEDELKSVDDANNLETMHSAAVIIQKYFRAYQAMKSYKNRSEKNLLDVRRSEKEEVSTIDDSVSSKQDVPSHQMLGVNVVTSRQEAAEDPNTLEHSERSVVHRGTSSTGLIHTEEVFDSSLPLEVQLNQPPGAEILTSQLSENTSLISVGGERAQASIKDASVCGNPAPPTPDKKCAPPVDNMDEKRINASIVKRNDTESEAATKIQASFRGYQVRKKLKSKNGSSDYINSRRAPRRKNSGRKLETSRNAQTITDTGKNGNDLEEKSATKIQAGIRGFLVRKRQKNAKKMRTESA